MSHPVNIPHLVIAVAVGVSLAVGLNWLLKVLAMAFYGLLTVIGY